VLELVFILGLPEMDSTDVLAALLVFRLFYLIVPFVAALFIIFIFERSQLLRPDLDARTLEGREKAG
jgi:uncharacterized membrane protein YbhN (UPF0104 family)